MIFSILWTMAWRDLGRNRRRTFFSILAVGLGLALLIVLNGYIKGVMEDALDNVIRMDTGHVQLRAPTYEADNMSLLWEDLLANPEDLAAQARTVDGVTAAAPVLWAGAYLNTFDESVACASSAWIPPQVQPHPSRTRSWPGRCLQPTTAAVSSSASAWPTASSWAWATRSTWPWSTPTVNRTRRPSLCAVLSPPASSATTTARCSCRWPRPRPLPARVTGPAP
ncbi:MAG: hypothetical protein R2854_31115 [Caldilineaceae bacterium]